MMYIVLLVVLLLATCRSFVLKSSIRSTCGESWKSSRASTRRIVEMNVAASQSASPYTAVMIIPTGIGASIGGFAGDGLPSAKLMASVVDTLITHPNVMNGAMLYWPIRNVEYVEGYALDEFAKGSVALQPVRKASQRIGLLLDKGMEEEVMMRHLQVADATRATLGIDVAEAVVTESPIGVTVESLTDGGASWGCVDNTTTLIHAAGKLIEKGCTAIAVVARFPEDEDISESAAEAFQAYRTGSGVDTIAGAEAIISHIITKEYMVPCAHAPAFASWELDPEVSPKAAAEEIGHTFLPCILSYLRTAPSLIRTASHKEDENGDISSQDAWKSRRIRDVDGIDSAAHSSESFLLHNSDVDAVVVPVDALGGSAVLSFIAQGKLIVAVQDNLTTMSVDAIALGPKHSNVVIARSYAEAAGIIAAHKAGILLEAITPHVPGIPITHL